MAGRRPAFFFIMVPFPDMGARSHAARRSIEGSPRARGARHRNPGLDAREKLTRLMAETEKAAEAPHQAKMVPAPI
ncbi:hypothetical protein [Rhizorhabdus wittichii]|uniref:hypothetical protein n=1 Tax=Rhizorhabdus wittichii TaxID=160791 RepID=UPI00178C727A|nr:hypothetical protein [Rhizorhabdus wittichii]